MKLNPKLLTHETKGEHYIISTSDTKFKGIVKNNDTAAFIVECLKIDTNESAVADSDGKKIAPDKIWLLGDVNSDGEVGVADAVLLQKWLLGIPGTELAEWTAADIYENNKLDAFDMILMRRLITQ